MGISCSFRVGNNKLQIPLLDAFTFLYITRSSALVLAQYFSINTTIVAGLFIVLCLTCFLVYSFASKRNICWDGIFLLIAVALFFLITLMIHPEYIGRYRDDLNGGQFGVKRIFVYGAGIYFYYIFRLYKGKGEQLNKILLAIAYTIVICEIWTVVERKEE